MCSNNLYYLTVVVSVPFNVILVIPSLLKNNFGLIERLQ